MAQLKAGTIVPTSQEDKAITATARRDPDAKPLTEAQWKAAKPVVRMKPHHPAQHRAYAALVLRGTCMGAVGT